MLDSWRAQVYLVGAGPGDPGLLTRRGEECLRRADVVFYDNLTNPELLKLARPDAEKRSVGKKPGERRPAQEWINGLLVAEARKGRVVVRLKGGDSFVFGRGGEEALALLEAGIRFEVVPGVTSAVAVPEMAGIPVTQRGLNTALHILTGYEDPDDPNCSVPWELLARSGQTIVILMGMARIEKILKRLEQGGLAPETPLAVIRRGSYPDQTSARMTLGGAVADPGRVQLAPPAISVLGAVAGLGASLNWFERRPLFGRKVILTHSEGSGPAIAEAAREAGAEVAELAAIRFEEIPDSEKPLEERLDKLREASGWLILPSPAAIRFFFQALEKLGKDVRALGGIRVAVPGEGSREALRARGIQADFISATSTGRALAENLPHGGALSRALIAGSSISRPELAEGLRRRGFEVEHHAIYSTEPDDEGLQRIRERVANAGSGTSIVVFSPSAAVSVWSILGPDTGALAGRVRWHAIGTTTGRAMRELGFPASGVAREPTPDGVIQSLTENSEN